MNGFQEVRLFVTATDVEPAVGSNTFTNILSQLLADDGPGTGTDITPGEVYTYLQRSAVVEGLQPGTHYFWVEAIDTVGNSSGVHRVGEHTIENSGVLWEFEVSVDASADILAYWIESNSFDINANNLYLENWNYMNEVGTPRDNSEYIEDFADSSDDSDAYGDILRYNGTTTLCTIRDTRPSDEISVTQFRVKWARPKHTPGIRIKRDGVTVYEEAANGGSNDEPLDNKVIYLIGIHPATLPGTHVVIAGATDAQDLANQNNIANSGFTLVDGVLTATTAAIDFDSTTVESPGEYTFYAIYRRDFDSGRMYVSGTDQRLGWGGAGNIITFSGSDTEPFFVNSSSFHVVVMRKNGSTVTWDAWDNNGAEVVRNITMQNTFDNGHSSFAPQIRNGASVKALGLISRVLSDGETEGIAAFLASQI
jgi:hypothetical protein